MFGFQELCCSPERLWGRLGADWCGKLDGAFRSSFRNHLKDVPEAISESQHAACSRCESGGRGVGGSGPSPTTSDSSPVLTIHPESSIHTQRVISSAQDRSLPLPEFPRGPPVFPGVSTSLRQQTRGGRMSFSDFSFLPGRRRARGCVPGAHLHPHSLHSGLSVLHFPFCVFDCFCVGHHRPAP